MEVVADIKDKCKKVVERKDPWLGHLKDKDKGTNVSRWQWVQLRKCTKRSVPGGSYAAENSTHAVGQWLHSLHSDEL